MWCRIRVGGAFSERARPIGLGNGNTAHMGPGEQVGVKQETNLRVVTMDHWKSNPGRSSALLAANEELARILEEVHELSATLKSTLPDVEILDRILQCAARQSLLDRELRHLALTDDLTGLYNRRAFLALAEQQLKVARRKREGLLLFFADLDHLKKINDSFGHREGDHALVSTAGALQSTFRDSDIVARVGGDEFAVLALEASCDDLQAIRYRLDRKLKMARKRRQLHHRLSLSVGVTRFDMKNGVSLQELMVQADRAMYAGKKSYSRSAISRLGRFLDAS